MSWTTYIYSIYIHAIDIKHTHTLIKTRILIEMASNNSYNSMEDTSNTLSNRYTVISLTQFLTVPSDVICFLCNNVMQEPIKAEDAASYCRICYVSKKEFTNKEKMPNFEKDEEMEKKIAGLICYCKHRVSGCDWQGESGDLDQHLTQCIFFKIQCQRCGMLFLKQFENAHKEQCSHVTCICGYVCHKTVFNEHTRVCDLYITCAKCTCSVLQQDFENHIKFCRHMYCSACNKLMSQEEMTSHIHELVIKPGTSSSKHVQLMIDDIKLARNMLNSCKLDVRLLQGEVRAMKSQLEEHMGVGEGRKDGTLMWIVEDVLNKLKTAKYNNQALFSPHFYSHENGYKMGAKLFLNGDCEANGSYISLYFQLYKGPFDDILPWPFSPRVSLQILGEKTEIKKTFSPEKTSLSFVQPQENSNIPSGYKRFAPQDILNQDVFVRGGKLFIKVVTDAATVRYP